jgi:hypothetical protein
MANISSLDVGRATPSTPPPIQFDRRISVGHIIVILGWLASCAAGYFKIEATIAQNTYRIEQVEKRQGEMDNRIATALDRIYDKLDQKVDRAAAR